MIKLKHILPEITIKKAPHISEQILKYFFSSVYSDDFYNDIKQNPDEFGKYIGENYITFTYSLPTALRGLIPYLQNRNIPNMEIKYDSVTFYSGFDLDDLNTDMEGDDLFNTLGEFLKKAIMYYRGN